MITALDPWIYACRWCDTQSQQTIDELKEGDRITFELCRDYPHSGRKTRTRTGEVQRKGNGDMFIMDYSNNSIQELFDSKTIVEIRNLK